MIRSSGNSFFQWQIVNGGNPDDVLDIFLQHKPGNTRAIGIFLLKY